MAMASPDAWSSEGVEASMTKGISESSRHTCSALIVAAALPREAEPSLPSCPRRPFSFFPKKRPIEDLMLFLLLDLCSES